MVAERGRAAQAKSRRDLAENAVESGRAAWCIIARVERTETSEIEAGEALLVEPEDEQRTEYAWGCNAEVEAGLQKTRNGILAKMDQNPN